MALAMDKYLQVRKAQAQGARTIDELKKISDIVIENEEEFKEVEVLIKNACRCKNVSIETVEEAVKNGADTFEKVKEVTEAGAGCGRCATIISNILGVEIFTLDRNKYVQIRKAQAQGARTIDELKKIPDIVIESEEELKAVEDLLKNACGCKNVSIETVVEAVKNGADTFEKVREVTTAGAGCGRCKGIISNIIENKR
ncbi:(2Fe-2S)-binding protein [Romboutsia weinsteinii]|uniref:(2Fe-2S)-binding protein n=1 Tax=Romboutsia weinsteinii TaxID=2020949 RepID=UPI0026D44B60|nr:(2Fe-2S)-binding protein [Romboutsia weinsteinii]